MRLKSLSIKGFKSFADETVINFNENLIGIVGPNGSGKSNIVDAIRWVLGEQKTTELRLESMSDVIFNGSKERKEGRISKVVLTFDNTKRILSTDFQEVSIARLLYRDGTSEYRLNDVPCRKKDIQSLFLDSGIGSHSYAIISLNMVEDILHDNGGSRRYMIEQAAGISKYKIRKKETLSKLKSTSEDLERVNDLLHEIKKNLNSFEKQAKRTEKYNELKDQYKWLSIELSKIEISHIQKSISEIKKKISVLSDEKIILDKKQAERTAFIEKIKYEILQSEQSLNKEQQEYNQLIEQLGKSENEKNLLQQQIINSKERLKDLEDNAVSLSISSKNAEEQIGQLSEKLNSLKINLTNALKELDEIKTALSQKRGIYDELRQKEKNVKEKIASQQTVQSKAEKEIESSKSRVRLLKEDIGVLEKRKSDFLHLSKELNTNLEEITAHLKSAQDESDRLMHHLEDLESQLSQQIENINHKEGRVNKKQLDLSSLTQRRKFLENVIENNEGQTEAVKYILKDFDHVKLFSDAIEILDESLTEIIELFFEPYLHHVIVQDEQTALTLINKVRHGQKGKLKVFVLDSFDQKEALSEGPSDPSLVPLISCIKINSSYQPLFKMLTDGVFVTRTSMKDISLQRKDENIKILSVPDYVLYTVGEMHGGSSTLFEGVQLGRRQMLEKIISSADRLQSEFIKEKEDLNTLRQSRTALLEEINATKQNLKHVNYNLEQIRKEVYKKQSQINSTAESISHIEHQLSDKLYQIDMAQSELIQKENHLRDLRKINVDDLNDDQLTVEIEAIYSEISQINRERDIRQQHVFELQNEYNVLSKEIEFHKNTLSSIDNRKKTLDNDKYVFHTKMKDAENQLEFILNSLRDLYVKKTDIQNKLSQQEDNYFKEKGRVFEYEKELNEIRNSLHQKDSLLAMTNEKWSALKFDLKAIVDRNQIEFGLELNTETEPFGEHNQSVDELKMQKNKLQDKLSNFGEINPMAITAYNEIKERYDHISKEQNDILDAKNSLEITISEIESAASDKFNDSLEQIKINFKRVFQGLFSDDDDCDIILMDTEDPLEAKIEIVAKPKGKKPKSINQLSGGEKTLTAASFLFALYLLKPAPFCIFDEVDAPLDDVNIQKFNKLIRKFSADSQFIIITHNKLTMAEVDILYGVYLKEQGVSGLSAVDFRSFDEADFPLALS